MKKLFFTIILFVAALFGYSQSAFVSIGNDISNAAGASVSYTYGQVFSSYFEEPGVGNVSEGVQQPYLITIELTDEICQDLDSTARYTGYGFNMPIQTAGTFNDEIYLVAGSHFGYDTLTKLVLTVNSVYYGKDTLLVYNTQMPYLYVVTEDSFDTLSIAGLHRVTLASHKGCDSIVDVMLYAVTCPADTMWVAPYNVCTVPANPAYLPQPSILPVDSASPVVLTNNIPNDFVVDDTTIVKWQYTVGSHSLSCDQNVFVAYPPCGDSMIVYDADSNLYHTVRVSCMCWTKENLRPTHYSDGTDIPVALIYNASGYSNTAYNLATYGRLYDWYSAVNVPNGYVGTLPDTTQGVCPIGWHIPTSLEYGILATNSSSSLKTTNLWIVPGTNTTDWSSVPGGYYSGVGYYQMSGNAYYWASDLSSSLKGNAFTTSFSCDYSSIAEEPMQYAYSVRCIKN